MEPQHPPQSPSPESPQDDVLSVADSESTNTTSASTRRHRRRVGKGNQKYYKCRQSGHTVKECPENLHNESPQPEKETPLDTFLMEVQTSEETYQAVKNTPEFEP